MTFIDIYIYILTYPIVLFETFFFSLEELMDEPTEIDAFLDYLTTIFKQRRTE
jgi:hypothetical protein